MTRCISINKKLEATLELANARELDELAPHLLQCLDETLDRVLEWHKEKGAVLTWCARCGRLVGGGHTCWL